MSELIELSIAKHQQLKVNKNCIGRYASQLHMVNVRVNEIAQMVSQSPVFFNKNPNNGQWGLSALTSFEPQQNLLVVDNQWQATYLPSSIENYPFFLMKKPNGGEGYTLGFDDNSQNFSESDGIVLFDEQGKATNYLATVKQKIEADISNDIHTYQFGEMLAEQGLLQAINIIVEYKNGSQKTIQGLSVINEDKFNALSEQTLKQLQQHQYLPAIYASLLSLVQLNTLVRKHNALSNEHITQISIEVSRDSFVK